MSLVSVMASADTAEQHIQEGRDLFNVKEEDSSLGNAFELTESVDENSEHIIDLTQDIELDVGESSVEARPYESTSLKEVNVKEEFIIVENPDYQTEDFKGFQRSIEDVDILPPPLTLDDPRPPRITKRKRNVKTNKNQQTDTDLAVSPHLKQGSHTVSRRLDRSCKNKIVDYSEEGLIDMNNYLVLKTETNVNPEGEPSKGQYSCDLCGASFQRACGLKRHQKWKHLPKPDVPDPARVHIQLDTSGPNIETDVKAVPVKTNISSGKKRVYPCPRCGRQFSFWNNMRRHLQIHLGTSKKFECPHCGKLTTSKAGLIGHIRFIHTGERPFICKVCSVGFATNSDLNRHKSKHSDVRKYKCSDCGKGFKQRSALTQHIQRKLKEKSWNCGVCAKRFSSKNTLKCHMVVHTKIKLFECESCQRQFSHKASLEAHMRVHAGLMPFMCSECGKKFAHQSNRNRHKRQVHNKQLCHVDPPVTLN